MEDKKDFKFGFCPICGMIMPRKDGKCVVCKAEITELLSNSIPSDHKTSK